MKTMNKLLIGLASVSLVACGDLTDDEIRAALEAAKDPAEVSSLNLKVGQNWTQASTTENISGLELKLEGNKLEYCTDADVQAGANCPSVVAGTIDINTDETVNWIVGKADVASLVLPGFTVRTTSTTTTETQNFFAKPGTYSTNNTPVETITTGLSTIGEYNHFVVQLQNAESDSTKGNTLYPSNPVNGRLYTDDGGTTYEVTGTTTVTIGDLANLGAHTITVYANNLWESIDHDYLVEYCINKNSGATMTTVNLNGQCAGNLLVDSRIDLVVYKDLPAKMVSYQRWLNLQNVYARQADTTAASTYDNSISDSKLIFTFTETVNKQESKLTQLAY